MKANVYWILQYQMRVVPWLVAPTAAMALAAPLASEDRGDVIVSVCLVADPPLSEEEASRIPVYAHLLTQEGDVQVRGRHRTRTIKTVEFAFPIDRFAGHQHLELNVVVKARRDSPFQAELRRLVRMADFGAERRFVVDLEIERREPIRVWVRIQDRATGAPIPGQPVALMETYRGGARQRAAVVTDSEGVMAFVIPANGSSYALSISAGGAIAWRETAARWPVPARPETTADEPAVWKIDVPRHSVQGRVTLEPGEALQPSGLELPSYLYRTKEDGTGGRHLRVREGRFDIFDLEPGTYHLSLSELNPPGYQVVRGQTFSIPEEQDEPLEHEVVVEPRKRARCDFVVIDKDTGEPLANVEVLLREDGRADRFTTDEQGRGRVRTWEGLHALRAQRERYAPYVAKLSLENRRTYRIELEPLKRTDAIVFDEKEQPLSNSRLVFVCPRLRSAGDVWAATTGDDGKAEVYGLPLNPFASVVTRNAQWEWWYFGRVEVPATEPLQLRLSSLVTLNGLVEGQVDKHAAVVPIDLENAMHGGRASLDVDGRFTLHVTPGRYAIYLLVPGVEEVLYPLGRFDALAEQPRAKRTFTFDEAVRKKATTLNAVTKQ